MDKLVLQSLVRMFGRLTVLADVLADVLAVILAYILAYILACSNCDIIVDFCRCIMIL